MFPPAEANNPNNAQETQKWMESTAANQRPQKRLIFDKVSKRLIAVASNDPRADQSLEFTPKEAQRFAAVDIHTTGRTQRSR